MGNITLVIHPLQEVAYISVKVNYKFSLTQKGEVTFQCHKTGEQQKWEYNSGLLNPSAML